ncbi:SDR family NAD(P)-dependent oxidoreductase [Sphingomonas sp. LB2R24]|uniref:SDR family NAD(P)-dependent oxidoreductase n=1 Tax=Sphingomonas sorbitolis TaxID=3096165 RepID=UPI002FC77C76
MKTFLSIGSGPGIGTATAECFGREGYRLVLTSRDVAKLDHRAAELSEKGYRVETRAVDAGDLDGVAALIRDVAAEFETIDVLHFNSAAMHGGTIDQQAADTFVPDLTINVAAALVAVQTVSPAMLARGSGSILLTSGVFAITPNPEYLSLGIGKAAIRNMAQALFDPFKDRGVHIAMVNVATPVAPGSAEALGVADAFWNLHAAPAETWDWEVTYPS